MNKPRTQLEKQAEKHRNYELLKREWVEANPTCTCAEYDAAIRRIASQCGV